MNKKRKHIILDFVWIFLFLYPLCIFLYFKSQNSCKKRQKDTKNVFKFETYILIFTPFLLFLKMNGKKAEGVYAKKAENNISKKACKNRQTCKKSRGCICCCVYFYLRLRSNRLSPRRKEHIA